MKEFLNRIGSIRWTISLLLLLAGVGAVGTFLPRGQGVEPFENLTGHLAGKTLQVLRFAHIFHSMWLRVLFVLLAVNLVACLITRIPAAISAVKGLAALNREPVLIAEATDEKMNRIDDSLKSLGFSERRGGNARLYSKGTYGYILTLLAHGSLLVIMISSLAGSVFGFVAARQTDIGEISSTAFNLKTGKDMTLPFEIQPVEVISLPQAVSVRLGIIDLGTFRQVGVINSYEGGTFRIPGLPGSVTLESFDIDTQKFRAVWARVNNARTWFEDGSEIGSSGLALVPVAYAAWPERRVLVKTDIRQGGSLVMTAEISVNHPVSLEGVTVYLTGYGQDRSGPPYARFQFVREPGKAGVWAGCVIFILTVTGALFSRHSCAVVRKEEGIWKVYLSSRGDREAMARAICDSVNAGPAPIEGA